MIPQHETTIHEILYGTSYPMRQLWGVTQLYTSENDDYGTSDTYDRQEKISEIADSVEKGTAQVVNAISTLQTLKLQSEESKRRYELAIQQGATTLEIERIRLALAQEEVNLAEINRVTALAETARKQQTTKYLVWGGVAIAGILTVALIVTKRK